MPIVPITIPNNGTLTSTLNIPIVEDGGLQLSNKVRQAYAPSTPLSCTLEDAISSADRYMHIYGTPGNPLQFVTEWLNLLRWEVANFWNVDSVQNEIVPSQTIGVSHEHRLRCGEVLAYGISLLLTERRLQIPRQNFFFYEHTAARPDFVIKLSQNHRFGVAWNRFMYGLESRWRVSQANLNSKDLSDLTRKKSSNASNILSGTIAVYCFYGTGKHPSNNAIRTRIHLADPPNDAEKLTIEANARIVLLHYAGVCSRIGLWEYRDFLQQTIKLLDIAPNENQKGSQDRVQLRNNNYTTRKYNNQTYIGTCYAPQSITVLSADDLGPRFVFWGLNSKVLEMIREHAFEDLISYLDPNSKFDKVRRSPYSVTSDGVIKYETTSPTIADLKDLK